MNLSQVETSNGVTEYRFEVAVEEQVVPGVLWRPDVTANSCPTLLLGHGRTGDKRSPLHLGLAQRMAARGWTVVAIDAPGHGDRRAPDAGETWPRPDQTVAAREWVAVIDQLRDAGDIDDGRIGYWGVSMGTSLGISLIAREPRIRAAVLGLMHPNWPAPPGSLIRADAARVMCPVLFLMNWQDSLVPRAQALELYDLFGGADKRLHGYPGEHGDLPRESMVASARFLARYLDAS